MYFEWETFPSLTPDQVKNKAAPPVVIVGAGPVGLSIALGLSQYGIACVVLERRTTISKGSRALAMNRRSMQILDHLGVGNAVMEKALTWSEGWTYYGNEQVHYMNIAAPKHEKHGQTNLQQCWMEQLLLEEISKKGIAEIRYGHEVLDIHPNEHQVTIEVGTGQGNYELTTEYLVAADGPRGTTRHKMGLDYEGTSYTQQFVINDIICKLPIPFGRRLFFNPPYLPGKSVLMHGAPFDMWRLDFQLLDDQDAKDEMEPEKVHARIQAHFKMMGLEDINYELLLTSIYRTNALSLPTYNKGRVLFAGDAAHQVPIFGGRGVNHGYADAHNLAWKLARVVKGQSGPSMLDTYTQERRGAILDTLAELTKTTLFITTPSPGIALMRDAVLSLSINEKFLNNLFDPYASPPYEYHDSPLNTNSDDEPLFTGGPRVGSIPPDSPTQPPESRLFDAFGQWFSLIIFSDTPETPADPAIQKALVAIDPQAKIIVLPAKSDIAKLYDANHNTAYLIRPDHRVAARWRKVSPEQVEQAMSQAILTSTHAQERT